MPYKPKRRLIPRIYVSNYDRVFPQTRGYNRRWFYFARYWSGLLIKITVRQYCLTLDFRGSVVQDLINL